MSEKYFPPKGWEGFDEPDNNLPDNNFKSVYCQYCYQEITCSGGILDTQSKKIYCRGEECVPEIKGKKIKLISRHVEINTTTGLELAICEGRIKNFGRSVKK